MTNEPTDEELIETFEALRTRPETVYMIRSHLDGADPEDCYRAYDDEQAARNKCDEMTALGETCTVVAISPAPETYDDMARIFSTGKVI